MLAGEAVDGGFAVFAAGPAGNRIAIAAPCALWFAVLLLPRHRVRVPRGIHVIVKSQAARLVELARRRHCGGNNINASEQVQAYERGNSVAQAHIRDASLSNPRLSQ